MVKCNTRYLRILGIDVLSLPEVSEFTKSELKQMVNRINLFLEKVSNEDTEQVVE
jgi:hypothetical protein